MNNSSHFIFYDALFHSFIEFPRTDCSVKSKRQQAVDTPNHQLNRMIRTLREFKKTQKQLAGLEIILKIVKPGIILVYIGLNKNNGRMTRKVPQYTLRPNTGTEHQHRVRMMSWLILLMLMSILIMCLGFGDILRCDISLIRWMRTLTNNCFVIGPAVPCCETHWDPAIWFIYNAFFVSSPLCPHPLCPTLMDSQHHASLQVSFTDTNPHTQKQSPHPFISVWHVTKHQSSNTCFNDTSEE